MIVINISLSDIPATARRQGTNGKWYTNIAIDMLKDKDSDGNTHTVFMSQTKEQRDAKEPKVYIGRGKEYVFAATPKAEVVALPDNSSEGLPF